MSGKLLYFVVLLTSVFSLSVGPYANAEMVNCYGSPSSYSATCYVPDKITDAPYEPPIAKPGKTLEWTDKKAYQAHKDFCNLLKNKREELQDKLENFDMSIEPNAYVLPSLQGQLNGSYLTSIGQNLRDITSTINRFACNNPSILKVKPKAKVAAAFIGVDVPGMVSRLFTEVYGRKITPSESTYWKQRARTDKTNETSLKGAMMYHKANKVAH